ncbi:Upf1, partial [Symbiodinium sp. CCMP2456]
MAWMDRFDPEDGPRHMGIQEHVLYANASCGPECDLPTTLYEFSSSLGVHGGSRCTCYHVEHSFALGKSRIYRIDHGKFHGNPPESFRLELESTSMEGQVQRDLQIEVFIREQKGHKQLYSLKNHKIYSPISSAWFDSEFFYRTEPARREGQLQHLDLVMCLANTHVVPKYEAGTAFSFPILPPSSGCLTISADTQLDDALCNVGIISWHTRCLRDQAAWPAVGLRSVSGRQQILLGTLSEIRQLCPDEMFSFPDFARMTASGLVGQVSFLLQQAGILAFLDEDVDGATRLACVVLDIFDSVRLAVPSLLQQAKEVAQDMLSRDSGHLPLAGASLFMDEFVMETLQVHMLAVTIGKQLEEETYEDMQRVRLPLIFGDEYQRWSSWPALRSPVVAQMAAMRLSCLVRAALRGAGTRKLEIAEVRRVFKDLAPLRRMRDIFQHFLQKDPYNTLEFLDLELDQMDYDSTEGKHHGHWPKCRQRDCLLGSGVELVSRSRQLLLPVPSRAHGLAAGEDEIKLALRVDPNLGAGLDLVPMRWGMRVETVEKQPGQVGLSPGDIITAVDGMMLGFADEDAVQEVFAALFRDGAELTISLRRVQTVLLPPEANTWPSSFEEDIYIMSEEFGIEATLLGASIAIVGPSLVITEAKEELQHIFTFYANNRQRSDSVTRMQDHDESIIWEDPWLVKFSQASISQTFRMGIGVDQTIHDIMLDRSRNDAGRASPIGAGETHRRPALLTVQPKTLCLPRPQ